MRNILLCLFAGCLLSCHAAPSAGAEPETGDPAPLTVGKHVFHRRVLRNGLRALAVQDDGKDVTVFMVIAAGKRQETPETTGLAHLTEHAMYTGTPSCGPDEHDARIEAMGGRSNAFTREDYTLFYDHTVPVANLGEVLAMEADRLRNITFDEAAVLHERDRLRDEEEATYQASQAMNELLESVVYRHHPYRAGILDEERHTLAPTLPVSLVHEFYDTYYNPGNTAVAVVGDVEPSVALDAIEAAFGGLGRGPTCPPVTAEPDVERARVETIEAGLTRDRWEYVWLTPPTGHPDRVPLDVLARILSRRKRPDGTSFVASMGNRVDRELFRVAATGPTAATELDELMSEVRGQGVDPAEVEEIKRLLRDDLAKFPLRREPYLSLAGHVATYEALGRAEQIPSYPARVDAVTPDDVRRVAREVLDPARRIAVLFKGTGEGDVPLPDGVKALETAAQEAVFAGDLDRAVAAYTKMLDDPTLSKFLRVMYLRERGEVHKARGDFGAAAADFEATLARFDWPEVRDLLDEVRALQGKPEKR